MFRFRMLPMVAIIGLLSSLALVAACGSSEPRTPAAPLWDEGFAADRESPPAGDAEKVSVPQNEWTVSETDVVELAEESTASPPPGDAYAEGWVEDLSTFIDGDGRHVPRLPPRKQGASEAVVENAPVIPASFTGQEQVSFVAPGGIRSDDFHLSLPPAAVSCVVPELPAMATANPGVAVPTELDDLQLVVDATCIQLESVEEAVVRCSKDIEAIAVRSDCIERKIKIVADDLERATVSLNGLAAKSEADAKRITELETQVVTLQQRPAAAPSVSVSAAPAAATSDPAGTLRQAWESNNLPRARNYFRALRIRQPELTAEQMLAKLAISADESDFRAWVENALASII
jgi:hypothetical protein